MKRSYRMVGLVFATFFVISFLTNILGPIIPDIIRSFHVSLAAAALLPFSFLLPTERFPSRLGSSWSGGEKRE